MKTFLEYLERGQFTLPASLVKVDTFYQDMILGRKNIKMIVQNQLESEGKMDFSNTEDYDSYD